MEPIRILHVMGRMGIGGSESMVMNIYRNIDKTKVQFDFVVHTTEKHAYDDEIISLGGKIYQVPKYNGVNHLKYEKSWEKIFKNGNYKIIHGHVRSTASIYLKIAKKFNIATISHSHSTSNGTGIIACIKDFMQKSIVNYADYLFAASKPAGKWLFGKESINKDNFYLFNNAIETTNYLFDEKLRDFTRKQLNISDDMTILGHVGRFDSSKNHKYLLKVFKEYQKKNKNSKLLLIGDGELFSKVEKKAYQLNLQKDIMFLGARSDVNQLLQAIDVFLLPSLYEGLSIAAIEAQASGLPCLLSNNVPQEVNITPNVHFLSINLSPEDWANKVIEIQNEFKRFDTSNYIIKAGYDINETSQWLCSFYLDIV